MDKVAVLLNERFDEADIQAILKKQAAWQRSRAERPWAQKLRDSVAMRRTLRSLKKQPSALTEMRPNQDKRVDCD